MAYPVCDDCGSDTYTEENPFVHVCHQRPSDHSDMCCVMWGHWRCLGGKEPYAPYIGSDGAIAKPSDLETWIESPAAAAAGYVFLT